MKNKLLIFGSISIILGLVAAAYFVPQVVITIIVIVSIMVAFGFGSWWSKMLMSEGALIALKAQESDDKRDSSQIKDIVGLVREVVKIKGISAPQNDFLALPEQAQLPPFRITGLDNDQDGDNVSQ